MKSLEKCFLAALCLLAVSSLPMKAQQSSEKSDDYYIERIEKMNSPIVIPYNITVRKFIIQYSERNKKEMGKLVGMCDYYLPIFEEAFDRYDLPLELKALAIVESRLHVRAVSPAGAKGLWQFTYAAGKNYGLEITSFIDDRFDVLKCTDAAARYLRDAYRAFGDWSLAICAYNCGYGGVRKAIARAGGKKDFWSIYPFLPAETRNYVPAFVGALYMLYYYDDLGIEPNYDNVPGQVDTLQVMGKIHLQQISDLVGTDIKTLENLNSQYKYKIIPDDGHLHCLTLPYEDVETYIALCDSIPKHKASEYMSEAVMKSIANSGTGATITYKVKEGDNLSIIASKHGVTVAKLKNWNHLKSDMIRPGQKLVIYK